MIAPSSVGKVPADYPAECERLAAMLPRIAKYETFQNDLIATSYWLDFVLAERQRSDPKAVRAELEDLRNKLKAALGALDNLTEGASTELHKRAGNPLSQALDENGFPVRRNPEASDVPHSAQERIGLLRRALATGVRWSAEAFSSVTVPRVIVDDPLWFEKTGVYIPDEFYEGFDLERSEAAPRIRRPGRPRDWSAEAAMRSLITLWEEQTGKPPTIVTHDGQKKGPFLDFCRGVIDPIYKARGLKAPKVGPLAQRLLYPPRAGKND